MTESQLAGIAGLGPARRKALLKQFSSLKRLRAATVDEIAAVPGFGPELAKRVHDQLAGAPEPEPAVNMTTGEVLG
jgi:excinuclease ABC subunit C